MERPKSCTDEHIKYLDTLSNSKITNMKGAGEYLVRELKLDKYKAREILAYWMKLRKEERTKQ